VIDIDLHRNRNAPKRPGIFRATGAIQRIGGFHCLLDRLDNCVQSRIDSLDPIQVGFCQVTYRNFVRTKLLADLRDRPVCDIGHWKTPWFRFCQADRGAIPSDQEASP
jgi:hypothetical protein